MNNPKGRVTGATFQSMQSLILLFLGALSSFSLVTGGEDEVFLPLLRCVWEQKKKQGRTDKSSKHVYIPTTRSRNMI